MKKLLSLFILILFSINCYAGTIDPNTPDEKYIDYAKKFHYIGLLIGQKNDDSYYSGSVVAYKDKIIITAAHLFYQSKQATVIFNKRSLPIKQIVIHNTYDYNKFGKDDIAVCLLSGDIGLEWYPDLYEDNNETGQICSLSGFGATGTFISGVKNGGGIKRAGSNFIDKADDYLLFCSPSVSYKITALEFLIAPGDSGGGLFINNKLAGIHSGVIEDKINKAKSKYGAVSAHTRISVYKDWIEKTTNKLMEK
jgi:hypothetical protein